MAKTRVLIVDDAVVFRKLIADEINADPLLEVVGTAANGRIALQKIPQVNPDIVILDVEMPELNGLQTLAELRKTYPRMPVIMFSSLTEKGAEETLDALALGANDYFTKPTTNSALASLEIIRTQLIPKIKILGNPSVPRTVLPPTPSTPTVRPVVASGAIEAVIIGCSTGGPNALTELFANLPAHLPVPILIVQHMPPMFTRLLAERLSAKSAVRVQEGATGTVLQPGLAWIAPGDYHMIVVRDGLAQRLLTHQDPPENSCRPAVDVMLRSAAKVFGRGCLAVILTGMGQDGLRGCEAIKEAGGAVLAQDEASSVVWGMPGYVAKAGLADKVLPLAQMASEIVHLVQSHRGIR